MNIRQQEIAEWAWEHYLNTIEVAQTPEDVFLAWEAYQFALWGCHGYYSCLPTG